MTSNLYCVDCGRTGEHSAKCKLAASPNRGYCGLYVDDGTYPRRVVFVVLDKKFPEGPIRKVEEAYEIDFALGKCLARGEMISTLAVLGLKEIEEFSNVIVTRLSKDCPALERV